MRLKFILLLVLAGLITLPGHAQKREFRGAWIHIVGNTQLRTMSSEEIQKLIVNTFDDLSEAGCNAVIFQVRPQADAFYASELEPWTRFLTGEQGKAPEPFWDPLSFAIDEAHKRGMELHAWCNPYRVTSNEEEVLCQDHLYFQRPDLFKRYGKQLYFDPGEPEARAHTVRVVADIVRRYDVDAIHFDDYFYPYPVRFEEFHDDHSFVKYAKDQGFDYWQKSDWRRNNVETLIRELNDTIKAIKPWVRFGISPFGIHRNQKDHESGSATNGLSNYDELFADVPAWGEKGLIDYIVPQLYWKIGHSAADYEVLIHWWNDGHFTPHLYIGQNIAVMDEPDTKNPKETQLKKKIQLSRELDGVAGNVWWPGWSLTNNDKNVKHRLETEFQKYPALIPAYTSLDSIAPEAPSRIHTHGNQLHWRVEPTEDPLQEALFCILYVFPPRAEVNFDDPKYIHKIIKGNGYDVAEELKWKKGTRIAVTVVDRCWNESKPSSLFEWEGYEKEESGFKGMTGIGIRHKF